MTSLLNRTLNGVATVLAMVINMIMSHFFLKHFHRMISRKSRSKPHESSTVTPIREIPVGSWGNDAMMGDVYRTPYPNYYYNGY